MTHTKISITIIPRYSNILVLAYPIHHLSNFIPSTPIPMTPNFNQMHSFLHQAPTDPQHLLNHDKHSLCTVTNVAWRPASRRQAVHQFWNFPNSCTAPTRLQISPTSRNFTIRTFLKGLYLFHRFSFQNLHTIVPYSTRFPNFSILIPSCTVSLLIQIIQAENQQIPLPSSYNYLSPSFSPIKNLPQSIKPGNRVNRHASPGGNSLPPGSS